MPSVLGRLSERRTASHGATAKGNFKGLRSGAAWRASRGQDHEGLWHSFRPRPRLTENAAQESVYRAKYGKRGLSKAASGAGLFVR
jgi:hypothetical protein